MDYVPPAVHSDAFNCPTCGAYSVQKWTGLTYVERNMRIISRDYMVGTCERCLSISIWRGSVMIYPTASSAPMSNPDMPDDIKKDYEEAREIESRSPRSACVLLRLCVEKMADDLVEKGDLNAKIGRMARDGLSEEIRKDMDTVRIIGGQAAHRLEMDLRDDHKTATALFKIVNYISDWAYTQKRVREEIRASMPDNKKAAMEKRDAGAKKDPRDDS